jgi:tetratricopeptide (TPR) repeat protein
MVEGAHMTAQTRSTRSLVAAVLMLTLGVLALGGAVIAVKLRPDALPTTHVQRTLRQWRDAVAEDPQSAVAHTGFGLALLDAGEEEQAAEEFEEAVRLDDRSWMAAFQLGVLTTSEDPERAIDLLARAARFAPKSNKVAPLVAEGDILLSLEDYEQAKRVFQRAIVDAPFILEAHQGLGEALEALGDAEGALAQYEEALRFDPENQELLQAVDRVGATA